MKIHCSFFATWGSRTKGGKLYTMRNLDWNANTGINKIMKSFDMTDLKRPTRVSCKINFFG